MSWIGRTTSLYGAASVHTIGQRSTAGCTMIRWPTSTGDTRRPCCRSRTSPSDGAACVASRRKVGRASRGGSTSGPRPRRSAGCSSASQRKGRSRASTSSVGRARPSMAAPCHSPRRTSARSSCSGTPGGSPFARAGTSGASTTLPSAFCPTVSRQRQAIRERAWPGAPQPPRVRRGRKGLDAEGMGAPGLG